MGCSVMSDAYRSEGTGLPLGEQYSSGGRDLAGADVHVVRASCP